jgi:hypothetical protein
MNFRILFFFSMISGITLGQGWLPMGARSASLANASVALEDVWAFHHNPGALASIDRFSAGVCYENRFLLRELQSQGMVAAQPLKTGVISIGAQFSGYELYRTQKVGVGYSLKMSEKLSGGVQLNYQGLRLPENYGSRNSVTAEAGVIGSITDEWKIAASVFNIGRSRLSEFADDRFTTLMRLGTSYKVSDKALFLLEAEKNLEYRLRGKLGVEYKPIEPFFIRFGAATAPVEISFGFGYRYKGFQLDLGSAYHQVLGWSPHFSFTYQSGKRKGS